MVLSFVRVTFTVAEYAFPVFLGVRPIADVDVSCGVCVQCAWCVWGINGGNVNKQAFTTGDRRDRTQKYTAHNDTIYTSYTTDGTLTQYVVHTTKTMTHIKLEIPSVPIPIGPHEISFSMLFVHFVFASVVGATKSEVVRIGKALQGVSA